MNQTVLGFIRKEFGQALRDPRMIAILFLMPVIQMLLFGYALRTDIRNIKLGVAASPEDRLARRIADRAFGSGFFVPVGVDAADPASDLASGRAHAVLVSPPGGLDRAMARGEGRMQLLVDATNAVRARNVEVYLGRILAQMAKESPAARSGPSGIGFDVRVLYNPALESRIFMVPAVAVFILGIVSVLLTSMAIAREKEMGTMEMLLSAPVAGWEIIAGKTLPYILVAVIDAPIVLAVATLWFGVPLRGSVMVLAAAALLYIITASSIGTLVSTLARNQQQAMMGSFMFMMPAIMLSGIMFPIDNMPDAVRWISYLDPLRYFVTLLRNIMLVGGDPAVVWPNLGALGAISVVVAGTAVRRLRGTLN